jgi:peroxin-2
MHRLLLREIKPAFKEKFEPELLMLMQIVLYQFSVYKTGASFGAQLQNLIYRDERRHHGGRECAARADPCRHAQELSE